MNAYSYTRLKAWSSCPLSYRLQYIDKVGQEEGENLVIGSAAHDFFELWVTGISSGKPLDFETVALDAWMKEARDQSLYEDYLDIVRDFIVNFDGSDIPIGAKTVCELAIGLTPDFQICDWRAENVRFRAKIDRVDFIGSKAIITDYKTSFAGKADQFQVNLYAWALNKLYPEIEEFEVVIHYTRSGWKERASFHRDSLGSVEFQLRALMDTIDEAKSFRAKPGSRCASCFVAFACEKKASNIKSLDKPKSAEKLASDVLVMEAQLDSKKKMLKEWVREHGEVKVNDVRFAFFPVEKMSVDTGELVKVLNQHEIPDAMGYLKADNQKVKKLCRENGQVADDIAPHVSMKSSLKFDYEKIEAK